MFKIHRFASVSSTLDVSKKLSAEVIRQGPSRPSFLIIAEQQLLGRGTGSRRWVSRSGNVYMTFSIASFSSSSLDFTVPQSIAPVLPLLVGLSCSRIINEHVACNANALLVETNGENKTELCSESFLNKRVELKWPNDLLISGKKIGGIKIESENEYFHIGIGINLASFPSEGELIVDEGRPADSLHTCFASLFTLSADELAVAVAEEILKLIKGLPISATEARKEIVRSFWASMDKNCRMYKREAENEEHHRGSEVKAVSIDEFGQLTVENKETGLLELLSADYLI